MTATERDLYRAWEVIETSDDTTADLAKHIAAALASERERALLAAAELLEFTPLSQRESGVISDYTRGMHAAAKILRLLAQGPPC